MTKFYEAVKYNQYYNSNNYGVVEVIGRKPNELKVKFLNSGNEYWFLSCNVVSGKIKDHKAAEDDVNSWKECNEEFENGAGHKFVAFAKMRNKYKVLFPKTGYTTIVYIQNAKQGKVTDPYEVSTYHIGYVGVFDRGLSYWKQAKQLWQNMMKRCYSEKDPRGYLGRCFVSTRWLCFSNFLEDLPHLDNFDLWLEGQNNGAAKYNLDKDVLLKGNNVYSKELCKFLLESENKSLGKLGKVKSDWEKV